MAGYNCEIEFPIPDNYLYRVARDKFPPFNFLRRELQGMNNEAFFHTNDYANYPLLQNFSTSPLFQLDFSFSWRNKEFCSREFLKRC